VLLLPFIATSTMTNPITWPHGSSAITRVKIPEPTVIRSQFRVPGYDVNFFFRYMLDIAGRSRIARMNTREHNDGSNLLDRDLSLCVELFMLAIATLHLISSA
jgi:hypothetical protein